MRIPRIHSTQALRANAEIALEVGPGQHVSRSLRMGPSDRLVLFNGEGGEYPAEILSVEKKQVLVKTGDHLEVERESSLKIHLGIAVSRGDRMDWVVQKATELGVDELSPLFTERTEVKLTAERAAKKAAHWRQVAVSACEQCGRNRLPSIHPLQTLESWLVATMAERKLVLHHRADTEALPTDATGSAALLVGPEGGLSASEIEAAERADYRALALGPRVLRTETAPLAAISILQARWGDMLPRL